MDQVAALAYHEKQEPGSMLCAQHCLNTLLQGPYFSAADLAEIAQNLDALEASYDDANMGNSSTNMDDTGFFSVQVLESALKVWGLDLKRWRSAEMRPFQDHPDKQIAFILNYQQHWYTIRRFGVLSEADPINSHWFNLNSYQPKPEWVSPTYLGMVLQQAEADGYSTFVITPTDPSAPLALPRSEADDVAATLSQGSSSSRSINVGGLEDEDMELQAVLQASLEEGSSSPPPSQPYPPPIRAAEQHASNLALPADDGDEDDDDFHSVSETPPTTDPVEASRLRNIQMLERMQREQRLAQQEFRHVADRRQSERDREEEEMLRQAIAESEALARGETLPGSETPPAALPVAPAQQHHDTVHVYDDEDAELQAALQASLQQHHEWEDIPSHMLEPQPHAEIPAETTIVDDARTETTSEADTSMVSEPDTESIADAEDVNMEEMRRRRLARFG